MKKIFLSKSGKIKALVYVGLIIVLYFSGEIMTETSSKLLSAITAFLFMFSYVLIHILIVWQISQAISKRKEKKKSKNNVLLMQKQENTSFKKKREIFNKEIDKSFRGKEIKTFVHDYVILDVETSGLSAATDEIIEVAALKVINDEIIDKYVSLIKPIIEIDDFITRLTGIKNEELNCAKEPPKVMEDVLEFIGDNVIIGHNVKFDIEFLYANVQRYTDKQLTNDYSDTLYFARKKIKNLKNYKLKTLAEHLNLPKPKHRSESDCITTFELYKKIKENNK